MGKGIKMDPRLFMAKVYEKFRNDSETTARFESEINNCTGPDDAIRICVEYLALEAVK
jgi:hypothetical protein